MAEDGVGVFLSLAANIVERGVHSFAIRLLGHWDHGCALGYSGDIFVDGRLRRRRRGVRW